jgi:hypothetical protein
LESVIGLERDTGFSFWTLVNSDSILWVLIIGLVIERIVDHFQSKRLRRATREALVNEFRANLEILDMYERQLLRTALGVAKEWPRIDLVSSTLDRALQPGSLELLFDTEQVHLAVLETTLSQFLINTQALANYAQGDLPWDHPLSEEFQIEAIRTKATKLFLSEDLARMGAVIVGATVAVVPEQGDFVLSPSIEMASVLKPLVSGKPIGAYIWRTSDLRRWSAAPGAVVTWRNDDPDVVPAESPLYVLYAGGQYGFDVVDRENNELHRRVWLSWRRVWIRKSIDRANKRLATKRRDATWP